MMQFKEGQEVEIVAGRDEVSWEFWCSDHARAKGLTGEIAEIDADGDIRVKSIQLPYGALWFPPKALKPVLATDAIQVVYRVGEYEFESEAEAKDHIARKLLTALIHPNLTTSEKIESLAKNKVDVGKLLAQVIL